LDHRCFYCFARAFEKLLDTEGMDEVLKQGFTAKMSRLYIEKGNNYSAPAFSRELYVYLRELSGNADPHKASKKKYNDIAMSLFPSLKEKVRASADPFATSLHLAVAGNIIDLGAHDDFDIHLAIEQVLNTGFALDHSAFLKESAAKAETILYLGDNAGEIVFDKLFIETLNHPNVIFAVRGAPVINDITMEDASYVNMNEVARVISNGYDAPSTILEKCSAEFIEVFNRADLIISKGQGNLEGLLEVKDKKIFFMLMAKCNVIAELLKVRKGDFIAAYNGML